MGCACHLQPAEIRFRTKWFKRPGFCRKKTYGFCLCPQQNLKYDGRMLFQADNNRRGDGTAGRFSVAQWAWRRRGRALIATGPRKQAVVPENA
jgi:hypothetical protein